MSRRVSTARSTTDPVGASLARDRLLMDSIAGQARSHITLRGSEPGSRWIVAEFDRGLGPLPQLDQCCLRSSIALAAAGEAQQQRDSDQQDRHQRGVDELQHSPQALDVLIQLQLHFP